MEIPILALPRTGSSLLAGILHDSGVSMGESFQPADGHNPTGYYEDLRLKKVLKVRHNRRFSDYIRHRNSLDDIWGMKDPEMCGRLHTVEDKFRDLKVIHLKRPISDSMDSLKEYYHNAANTLTDLNKRKYEDLKALSAPVLDVELYEFIDNPKQEYERICDFIGIEPYYEALDRIDNKHLNHRVNM